MRTLGIDLGTTNSVMAYIFQGSPKIVINRQNHESTPSAVALGKRGELLVGTHARRRGAGAIVSIKRFMGRRFADPEVSSSAARLPYKVTGAGDGGVRVRLGEFDYTPIEISTLILRRLKLDAEQRTGEPFNRAVITVPAYFGERQVAATREAGERAGFHVLKIINEPTAAAIAFGLAHESSDEPRNVLVYDLGGGTFDISVLLLAAGAIEVLGVEGDNLLGGDDFDELLYRRLCAEAEQEGVVLEGDLTSAFRLRAAAEEMKMTLSDQLDAEAVLPALGASAVTVEPEISRDDFEALISERIDSTIALVRKALADAAMDVDLIDQVLLVGGSTAIPLVERRLAEVFGAEKIRKDVNPMQCVAIGAAVQSALMPTLECPECNTANELDGERCTSCGTGLAGSPKADCARCHLPVDLGEASCGKCGTPTAGAAAAPAPAAAGWKCANCAEANPAARTSCALCGEKRISEGLRCTACDRVNPAGAEGCVGCGEPMVLLNPQDITPKNLGIDLDDGSMEPIIKKGTLYPTSQPIKQTFYTSGSDSRRLEILVYEGDEQPAVRNELVGTVNVDLVAGLATGTPVDVSFGLSSDRTITVTVQVRVPGAEPKRVKLERADKLTVEDKKVVTEELDTLGGFIDRLGGDLTPHERRAAESAFQQVEQVLREGAKDESADKVVSRAAEVRKALSEIRAVTIELLNLLDAAGHFLNPDERQQLLIHLEQLQSTREQADWIAGRAIVDRARAAINALPPVIPMIAEIRGLQHSLSPGLQHRIRELFGRLESAVAAGDREEQSRLLHQIPELHHEVYRELSHVVGPGGGPGKLSRDQNR